MSRSTTVSVAPTVEPVSLTEMKLHLRVDSDDTSQDSVITALIQAAREHVEHDTGLALVTQTQILRMDAFPLLEGEAIELSNPPLQSVSSIQYVDTDGVTQTMDAADYIVDSASLPARITPAYGTSWPSARDQVNAVTVTYVAGFAPGSGSPTDYTENVPEGLKAAIKLLAGAWYEHREAVGPLALKLVPMAYESLIWSHRVINKP